MLLPPAQEAPCNPGYFNLDNLPKLVVELIAEHASTPATHAACLLPQVSRGWKAAADRAELTFDITLDLATLAPAAGSSTPIPGGPPQGSSSAGTPPPVAGPAAAAPPPPASAAAASPGDIPPPSQTWWAQLLHLMLILMLLLVGAAPPPAAPPPAAAAAAAPDEIPPLQTWWAQLLQRILKLLGAAAAATAAFYRAWPRPPAPAPKAASLAAWLRKYSHRVRTLVITGAKPCRTGTPAWLPSLKVLIAAVFPQPPATAPSPSLPSADVLEHPAAAAAAAEAGRCCWPHLITLDMPVLRSYEWARSFSQVLPWAPALQRLTLRQVDVGRPWGEDIFSLAERRIGMRDQDMLPYALADLLRRLPPTLQRLQLEGWYCPASIPLSCMTHLVNLREWEHPGVALVTDDISSSDGKGNSSSRSSGGSGSSSSRTGRGGGSSRGDSGPGNRGARALTALTSVCFQSTLLHGDARLGLPNLREVRLNLATPGAWQQLQQVQGLKKLVIDCSSYQGLIPWNRRPQAGLEGMRQVEELVVWLGESPDTNVVRRWADSIAHLTQLQALTVPACVVGLGAAMLLMPLEQLTDLTVDCRPHMNRPQHPHGQQPGVAWATRNAKGSLMVLAAAVRAGWGPLRQLQLMGIPRGISQQVTAAAAAALPGVEVHVLPAHA